MTDSRTRRFTLKSSRPLAVALVAAHGAAGACSAALVPGLLGLALATALLALGGAAAWSRALHRARGSVRAIVVGGPRDVALELRDGRRLAVAIAERRYVSAILVALPLSSPARRTLLVTADMLAPRDFRALRIWAAWGRLPGVAPEQLAA